MDSEKIVDLNMHKDSIHQEKVKTLYDAMIFILSANIINASILGMVQWSVIDHDVILGWWGMLVAVNIWRYKVSRDFRHEPSPAKNISKWERRFTAGAILAGVMWGLTSIFLFPQESFAHQAFLVFVLAGMSAGAIAALSAIWKNFVIFLGLLLIPLIITLLLDGTSLSMTMTAMVLLFMVMLVGISRNFSQSIAKTLEMRYRYQDAKERLRVSEERFATIFEEALTGIFYYNLDMEIVECNDYFAKILKAPKEKLIGMDMNTLQDKRVIPAVSAVFSGEKGEYTGEYHTKISGIDKWILMRTTPIYGKNRKIVGGVGIVEDMTQQKHAEKQIRHQAYHDMLTGLPNRILLTDRLSQALARARRSKGKGAVLFLDLDHFKTINDSLGHDIGDELLRQVVVRLSGTVRRGEDTVSRFGGDEFVILLSPGNHDEWEKAAFGAQVVAKKIQEELSVLFEISGHRLYTSASIGIALFPEDG
ncbi:MAG: sensor domain-containing diguanylate cyclase, partial [Sulfurimonas sp.]